MRKLGKERYERELRQAVDHILFMLQVYALQIESGRYFVHEHPPAGHQLESYQNGRIHLKASGLFNDEPPVHVWTQGNRPRWLGWTCEKAHYLDDKLG